MTRSRLALALVCAAFAGGLLFAGATLSQSATEAPPQDAAGRADGGLSVEQLLARTTPPNTPNRDQVERGRQLVIAGDCAACHTKAGGAPFAGSRPIRTPFGVIYSPNITSDHMKHWSADQFYRALHRGLDDDGHHLYPAFPYTYFVHVTRADSDAMLAYLRTTPAVAAKRPANALPFPLNIRGVLVVWNALFFHPKPLQTPAGKSAAWARGQYLVEGPGHCGACHTPKNMLGADETSKAYQGGVLDNWEAPNLTADARTGLGAWSVDDIVEYLKTGRNARAQAGGPMAEVVSASTSMLPDPDLRAIAVYLKDRPAAAPNAGGDPDRAAMARGEAIWQDTCSACHLQSGEGQARFFPPMRGNQGVQQGDPTNVVRVILEGVRTAPTPTRPTPLSMPSYAWKLTDREIADVATYVRNAWGNKAAPVGADKVASLRRKLDLIRPPLSSWSKVDQR